MIHAIVTKTITISYVHCVIEHLRDTDSNKSSDFFQNIAFMLFILCCFVHICNMHCAYEIKFCAT